MTAKAEVVTSGRPKGRGYSWPPFEKGNTKALKHGFASKLAVSEKAKEVHAELMEACPFIIDCDIVVVDLLCTSKARYDMIVDHLDDCMEGNVISKFGEGILAFPPYLWAPLNTLEKNIADIANRLGLDPTGRMGIFKNFGAAMYLGARTPRDVAAEGRAIRESLAADNG
jgi:hypothetical protein